MTEKIKVRESIDQLCFFIRHSGLLLRMQVAHTGGTVYEHTTGL
jgi:hypothetical protein